MFFQGWSGLTRTAMVGVLAYLSLVVLLRVSGKRMLSKMNAFDLVVTVALGSTLVTIVLSQDVALLEDVGAFAVLIGMQFGIAWLSVRSLAVSRLVKAEPRLLVYDGHLLHSAMRDERGVEAEILAAVRQPGIARLDAVEAVVLETEDSFTLIPRGRSTNRGGGDALHRCLWVLQAVWLYSCSPTGSIIMNTALEDDPSGAAETSVARFSDISRYVDTF